MDNTGTTAVALAVTTGTLAVDTGTVRKSVRETYFALMRLISSRYSSVDLENVHLRPDSPTERKALAGELDDAGAGSDVELVEAAIAVLREVQQHAPQMLAGVDLQWVEAGALHIVQVKFTGEGLRAVDSTINGDVEITVSPGESVVVHGDYNVVRSAGRDVLLPDSTAGQVDLPDTDRQKQINIGGDNVGPLILHDGNGTDRWRTAVNFEVDSPPPASECVIYLDTNDESKIRSVLDAVIDVLDTYGLKLDPKGPPLYGSWFARFKVRSKDAMNNPDVQQRLQKLEQAIEVKTLQGPMSQVNVNQADATLRLAQAVSGIDNAALLIGSILVIKTTAGDGTTSMIARSLSVAEIRALEANQHVLKDPPTALARLEDLTRTNHTYPSVPDPLLMASLTDGLSSPAEEISQRPPDL
ncbi:hypothetical protein [Nocardia sp. NPDC059239]|uniref:hypothetical protein n=1 Tax=unclassified Nocardia TaxID=2637762 RepID=UPI0036B78B26